MKRIPARRAALVATALVLSCLVPGLGAAAGAAAPDVTVAGTIRSVAGTGLEGEVILRDGRGAAVGSTSSGADGTFTLDTPPGPYTLHFEAPVSGYLGGFKSGDDGHPGLFVDLPIDVATDSSFEVTVPIVDFPVHVVDRAGNPAPGLPLVGTSQGPVDLGAGLVGSGSLLQNSVQTDAAGNGTLRILRGAAPAMVAATDWYAALGQVTLEPSATSAVIVLDNPVLQGDLLDPRGPLPAAAAENTYVNFVGGPAAGQFAPWPYSPGGSYRIQGPAGDVTLYVTNERLAPHDVDSPRPASATLPGRWEFVAPYHL
ncbi:MAG TPA: carboxypeptidase-like regulatory domain-containing protein, partial [Acidimicrobiia bacterium]|nr:carboxypeptidase-like regulatory domain-containing protein [Acidimicrobiia bacterium]